MKGTFFVFAMVGLLGLSGLNSEAQTPNWLWAKSAGSNSYDYAQSVVVDSSGCSYITGYFNTAITFGLSSYTSAGSADIYIVKYDPEGNLLWSDTYGGTDGDMANSIAVDRFGNFFVTGYFKSSSLVFGTYTLTNAGGNTYDLFLVKFDPEGNVLWAHSAGGTKDDRAYGVAVDTMGNCYLTGYYASSSITFDNETLTNSGNLDMFIVKCDPDGSVLWAKSATGPGADYATAIAVDINLNSYVTGSFNGSTLTFGTHILDLNANKDMYIVKYAPDGSVKWASNAGVQSDNVGISVAVDTSGNSFVTGSFKGNTIVFGSTTLTNQGNADIFVVKYDSLGAARWAKSAGGSLEDAGDAVSADKFGYCYVTGHFKSASISFETNTLTNAGSSTADIFITEFNPDGNLVWSRSAGSTADDIPYSSCVDTLRNYYIAGYFGSPNITFDATTLVIAGTTDMFVAKSDNTVITGAENIFHSPNISLYPNPVQDYITLQVPGESVIEIFNSKGQMIKKVNSNSTETTIDISRLEGGIYILKVTTGKEVMSGKFIKQ